MLNVYLLSVKNTLFSNWNRFFFKTKSLTLYENIYNDIECCIMISLETLFKNN